MWKQTLKTQLLTQPNQIFGLDAFRGLAALMVFAFHFYGFFLQNNVELPNWFEPFLAGGHIGINIFFVLSGFLVFLSFIRSRSTRSYLYKRIIRIAPLAFAYLAVVFWYKGNFDPTNWHDLIIHTTFTQSLFKESYHGQFPVMWTLSLEWLFYLFVPFYVWITRKNFRLFVLGLIFLTLANWGYRFWISQFFSEWSNFERIFHSEQLWGRFDHFVLGIFLGIAYAKGLLQSSSLSRLSPRKITPYCLVITSLITFFYLWYQFGIIGSAFRDQIWLQIFFHFSIALTFTVFLAGFISLPSQKTLNQNAAHTHTSIPLIKRKTNDKQQSVRAYGHTPLQKFTLKKILAPNWFQYLGKISYGIYLWHFFVLEIFMEIDFNLPQKILLITATTIGLSVLSWHLIELPCLKLKRPNSPSPAESPPK